MIRLSRLYIHPVKSMKGIRLSQAYAENSGLVFDRYFMVTNDQVGFITARQYLQMLLFKPIIFENGIQIQTPDKQKATILYKDFINHRLPTEVWGNHFTAFAVPAKINQASFKALQKQCPSDIKLEQFRGNLIITSAKAFAEDSWHTIQIGEVIFELVKPCSSCILTTVNIDDGSQHPTGEPLTILQSFHTDEHGEIDFGQNAIAKNSGLICVGDTVKILTKKQPKQYKTVKTTKRQIINLKKETTLLIDVNGTEYLANNQIVILEQLEKHGLKFPYSCRAGICGCCKMKLIAGEVIPLTKTAIKEDGVIQSCSCIPKTNIKLLLG
ncbi:Xylene monooxygenase electron transfer component [Arsenophonus endosymbiont of Aleurodicus floccissimus]|uniref:YcbX family protein n=1 Tax=Arsenophonus endosymbiont of Aleurodicus floccissimus TaxID=2152761 RepID=UPI000E6B44CE|nr:MOSC N-terminal beta barrel domain-containing protein [Arsenophonus endosymbiont of Aleurodicus floccissimus]SPP31044.1 Xylene monooxygenase electron transfer component [Arsenophonus endosymbiont of Aleurodicus floccissimus]